MATQAASAQRASENAVTQADDAFGTSVGNEQVGLYSSFDVRGFSPTVAGNVRIAGLYFDQVTELNPRIDQSSQIRVGIAAQGYAFPAPTGVVDHTLRTPGNSGELSGLAETNTRGTTTLEFDGAQPLIDNVLSIGGGVGFHRDVQADGTGNYQNNEGVVTRWTPRSDAEVLFFWSRADTYGQQVGQVYLPEGPFLPQPNPGRHFFGPNWASNREFDTNYGALAHVEFLPGWELRAGLFRSAQKKPNNIFVALTDLTLAGAGDLNVFSDPPSSWGSTSGEVRLEHSFAEGPRVHRAILSVRMRNWNAIYGGSDFVDLGAVAIGQRIDVPLPVFHYTAQTYDHIDEMTLGLSYQVAWKGLGVLGLGIQRPNYLKKTLIPGSLPAISADDPWLFNAALTGEISQDMTIYGDYTRGLEDSGIAPQNASNRNQAMPAITTRQKDVGLRWAIAPDLKLVTGLFDIHKPYFNLDTNNRFSRLGETENRGLEISLSGNVLPELDVVAGAVLSEPKVTGEAVRLGLVGSHPVAIPSRQFELNANWHPPSVSSLSFDLGIDHQGSMASTLDNRVFIPERTFVNADARYAFTLDDRPASLRFWLENIFDTRGWDLNGANTYNIYWNSGRRLDVRLIVDL